MPTGSSKTLVIAVVAFVIAAGLGYWGYAALKKREGQKSVVAAVTDVSARLREALTIEAGPQAASKLDEHAAAADRALQEIKRLDASANRALVDAADNYLLTAREILKRQSDRHRHGLALADSLQALRQHMRADNRTGTWVQEAVKARERVNKDYRGYGVAAEVLGKLLESLPATQKSIAPLVGGASMIPGDLIASASKRVQQEAQLAATEVEKLKLR